MGKLCRVSTGERHLTICVWKDQSENQGDHWEVTCGEMEKRQQWLIGEDIRSQGWYMFQRWRHRDFRGFDVRLRERENDGKAPSFLDLT
jgi:hypothetical protein